MVDISVGARERRADGGGGKQKLVSASAPSLSLVSQTAIGWTVSLTTRLGSLKGHSSGSKEFGVERIGCRVRTRAVLQNVEELLGFTRRCMSPVTLDWIPLHLEVCGKETPCIFFRG